jgi:hypothetical protein
VRATGVCVVQLFVMKAITSQEDRCGVQHVWGKLKKSVQSVAGRPREKRPLADQMG